MKQATLDKIEERAKTKKDGVYVFDCIHYAVKDARLIYLINFEELYACECGFLVYRCKVNKQGKRKILKKLLGEG